MIKDRHFQQDFAGRVLKLESGKVAHFASGSVLASYGGTVVLATTVISPEPREGVDFLPLLVDYEEKLYAAGKISGSRFIKREGRPSETAVLTARLIDRPLRPLFPKHYRNDVQIILTILSYDNENDPNILSMNAASAALLMASAPFSGPLAAVMVGKIDGKLVCNPKRAEQEESDFNLVLAGTKDKIMMIDLEGKEVIEEDLLAAIEFGQKNLQPLIELQEKLSEGIAKIGIEEDQKVYGEVKKFLGKKLKDVTREIDRAKRDQMISEFEKEVLANFEGDYKQVELKKVFSNLVEKEVRVAILKEGVRPDGRKLDEMRPIDIQVGILPRTHGSALFSRGDTQALTIATLGAPGEEQVIETMEEEGTKRFMHHYNFPPFSTGEVAPLRGASRREIGHGVLAEKALEPMLPSKEDFPYTIRLVSEILSSNGSTSMASVCGSSLALMDAGIPIKKPVAGISIGLMTDERGKSHRLLTDIQGLEDFAGDMDFKVAGTESGITAIQLDLKIRGIDRELLREALERAKKARQQILAKMKEAIAAPHKELSVYAPRIYRLKINPAKIGEVIGPGGKVIHQIINDSGGSEVTDIDIEDDGTVLISSTAPDLAQKALERIKTITRETRPGEIFSGKVTRILDFGAMVEIWPGQEGLVHISQLAPYRVREVSDIVKVGDIIKVKVINIDEQGRVNLSLKAANEQPIDKKWG